jgi:tRNA(Ile)-lysidine synthase
LLRPLLTIQPEALRAFLTGRGVQWVEDPSNQDMAALRPRLRRRIAEHRSGASLADVASTVGALRAREEAETAIELANRATIRPEGFALLSPGRIGTAALAHLIRTIAGAAYLSSQAQISDLAARPRPSTVSGARLLPAGRYGKYLLLVREEAAMAGPMDVYPSAVWDGRFRLAINGAVPSGLSVGKLGNDATRFRRQSQLPSAVLRTLPAIRIGERLTAVPHLGFAADNMSARLATLFCPRMPAAGSCFLPA